MVSGVRAPHWGLDERGPPPPTIRVQYLMHLASLGLRRPADPEGKGFQLVFYPRGHQVQERLELKIERRLQPRVVQAVVIAEPAN